MRRTKEEAQKTREKIFKCALKLFIEKGYDSTTLKDITQKAGVTKGAVYWHFRDKDAILDEIIDHYDNEAINNLPLVLKDEASPLMKIKFLTYPNFPDLKSKKKIKNYFRLKAEISNHWKRRGKHPYAKVFVKEVTGLFKEAKRKGEVIKSLDPDAAALSISFLITGTYIKYDIDDSLFDNVRSITTVMDEYFDHISTDKGIKETKDFRKEWTELLPILFAKY